VNASNADPNGIPVACDACCCVTSKIAAPVLSLLVKRVGSQSVSDVVGKESKGHVELEPILKRVIE
jgi:hypothetical protein